MKLIADSGSTKTEWSLIDNKKEINRFCTPGINPFYQNVTDIAETLKKELPSHITHPIHHIYFYGAGCTNPEKKGIIDSALSQVFNTTHIFIASDLLGAARALCQHQPGIACILGTGSKSCYYDGKDIVSHVSPLGFILGDEGSGAVMGKRLIADILKNQLPQDIIQQFYDTYRVASDEILDAVYKKPFPNRYLAQYTKFLSQHIHIHEIEELVSGCFDDFISRNILQYKQAASLEIGFIGSIAYYFKPQLIKSLKKFHLKEGQIIKTPLENLIIYHI